MAERSFLTCSLQILTWLAIRKYSHGRHASVAAVNAWQVTYRQLLNEFWGRHDPTSLNKQGNDVGTQYRAGIYTHTPQQQEEATKWVLQLYLLKLAVQLPTGYNEH